MKKTLAPILAGLIVCLVLLSSCMDNTDQELINQETSKNLAEMATRLDEMSSKIRELQDRIDDNQMDLTRLKQRPEAAAVSSTELEEMKSQLNSLNSEFAAMKSVVADMKSDIDKARKLASSRSANVTSSGSSSSSSSSSSSDSAPKPTPAPEPKKTGKYYTVKQGDTMTSIAEKFGLTEKEILDANPILRGRGELIAGNRLWIVEK